MARSLLTPRQTAMLAFQSSDTRRRMIEMMTPHEALIFDADFENWALDGQREPGGEGWRCWLMMAGRGFGKTRAGAEWISRLATHRGRRVRIALVGATQDDARRVMIEGPSGLLTIAPPRLRPRWEPSRGLLRWPGGSEAQVYSGESPDGLRGGEFDFAWCDELAKWARPDETWDNLQFALRGGERPRALVTTTPRPIAILKRIESLATTVTTRGRTDENAHLSEAFVEAMLATYGGTRLGRQELDGVMLADIEGALWTRGLIEGCRVLRYGSSTSSAPTQDERSSFTRVVVGVDPPVSANGDACGIVVCGVRGDGVAMVLEDASVAGASPEGWARAVADAAARWSADRVIAEANQGGAMVESVLRAAEANLPVTLVHASKGKVARAEPVAALFEKRRALFAGAFPQLEDELAGLKAGGGYEGPGRSPDRADAMVWALTELMLKAAKGEPGVRLL